jgi:hypothetical protein
MFICPDFAVIGLKHRANAQKEAAPTEVGAAGKAS